MPKGFCTKFQDILKLVTVPPGASFLKFKNMHYRCRAKYKKKQKYKLSYNRMKHVYKFIIRVFNLSI